MTPHPLQSPTAFKQARHTLGLSCQGLADALHVGSERTIRRWEHGDRDIPEGAALTLAELLSRAG